MPSNNINVDTQASAIALLPLGLFLLIFIGTGTYMTLQGVDMAFYQLSAPVAALPAIVLGILLSKEKLNRAIEQFLNGAGHSDIIAMCMIYLLAGAFAAVASATGGVEATVNLGMMMIPDTLILPGIFVISAFIATSMGTSMGTIAAVAPVALGIANAADMDIALTAGVVLSGAMFGDNLSIISDTTIAATRSQGCEMKDKFRENIRIALPAAIAAMVLFAFSSKVSSAPVAEQVEWLKVLPYLTILVLAVAGLNVFVVLSIGILLAGLIGFISSPTYMLSTFANDIYGGFSKMQEIFLLSMMIGGLGELMRRQGGLVFITRLISRLLKGKAHTTRNGEAGIAAVVGLTNACTANNTVAIIVAGGVAKEIAEENHVSPRRSASLLDIYSCVVQGLLPYGAQALLLGSVFGLSPLTVVSHSYYCFFLAIAAAVTMVFRKRH
ncbi:Na+/H+ antiporter NhaC family protein [Thaumasiovibrio subtropicus]|uniref:Na+/H+ antiporter NhaC family protein n=1 Tax=Thaumasiovibrio subtropicus TaxID=1891207 RepID=UPI000B3634A9|nr:Na+/H+ antiporter NhaC family protein [Thaumasiovibrio subtropicus]